MRHRIEIVLEIAVALALLMWAIAVATFETLVTGRKL
jgi:hypothetical protein